MMEITRKAWPGAGRSLQWCQQDGTLGCYRQHHWGRPGHVGLSTTRRLPHPKWREPKKGVRGRTYCSQGGVGRDGFVSDGLVKFFWNVTRVSWTHICVGRNMFGNSGNCKKKKLGILDSSFWKKQQEYFRNIPFFLFQIKTTGATLFVAPHLLLIGAILHPRKASASFMENSWSSKNDDSSRSLLRYIIFPAKHAYIHIARMATCFPES